MFKRFLAWWNRPLKKIRADAADAEWFRTEYSRLRDKVVEIVELSEERDDQIAREVRDLLNTVRSEPFAAMKTWIDRSTEDRRTSMARERELLERWKSHTAALEEQIRVLQQELIRVTGVRP